jgi:hypothetical protein
MTELSGLFWKKMMAQVGVSHAWTAMVMRCVTSTRFAVKLNRDISEGFMPTRGLRQGDPLSPYLFLFCVEGFSALLKQALQENEIQRVSFGRTSPNVTHLLFANDSIVFLEASSNNLTRLRQILQAYEEASGQKVNL